MARLNNISFYLVDYSYDSNIGNYAVKIAGSDRNIVLNLGKDVATLTITALCKKDEFKPLKDEFNQGALSVVELDEDTRYYCYPDAIAIRRAAGDPIKGDYTDWREVEMSFLLPDPIMYGDRNCTSFNITGGSPTGTLKNISIGGKEETPLSVSFVTYNITRCGYIANGTEISREFGEPDCLWLPGNYFKIYRLANTKGVVSWNWTTMKWGAGCTVRHSEDGYKYLQRFYILLPPLNFPSNESFAWALVNANGNYSTEKISVLDSWLRTCWYKEVYDYWPYWIHDTYTCETWLNAILKLEFMCTPGTYSLWTDIRGRTGDGSPLAVHFYKDTSGDGNWNGIQYQTLPDDIKRVTFEITPDNLSNGWAHMLIFIGPLSSGVYEVADGNGTCPWYRNASVSSLEYSFFQIHKLRHPEVSVVYPASGISYLNGIIVNGSVINSASDKIVVKVYKSDYYGTPIELLAREEIDEAQWNSNTLIPLITDVGNADYIKFYFTSALIDNFPEPTETTYSFINETELPRYSIKLKALDLGDELPKGYGYHMYTPTPYFNVIYGEFQNYGLDQVIFSETLTYFQLWNKLEKDMKFTLKGHLLGEYSAQYLHNLEFSFRDDYTNNYLFAMANASIVAGHLEIGSDGAVYYSFAFGIPLIEEPSLFMRYTQAPSAMKLIDADGNEHAIDIPDNNVTTTMYSSTYSLVTRDSCFLKIEGPANISEFDLYAAGSAYLYTTPYLYPNTNNIIEYNVSGTYSSINGTLCWREAI